MSTTEEVFGSVIERPSFLMPQYHHFGAVKAGEPDADRAVIAKEFVAMQLNKFIKNQRQVIDGVRTVFMTRHLHGLPWRQVAVRFPGQFGQVPLQLTDLFSRFGRVIALLLKLIDFFVEIGKRLLEFQVVVHRCLSVFNREFFDFVQGESDRSRSSITCSCKGEAH